MAPPQISPIGEKPRRPDMNREEAQATCDTIRRGIDDIRDLALDLHDRKGWSALGYESWRTCVESEFGMSKRHINRQLAAALIESEVGPIGPTQPPQVGPIGPTQQIPESQLRPLSAIPEGERREVWEEATATAPNGKVTAQHVRKTVDRKLGKTPAPVNPKTIVNGVAAPDPPDVAKARASGRIAPEVVVEITEPVTQVAPEEPGEDVLSDDDWLMTLPLHEKLSGSCLRAFDKDALYFRAVEPSRKTFQHHASRVHSAATQSGHYAYRTKRWIKTDHPKHWLLCPTTENGGCGGDGQIPLIGQCSKCRGKGYWIK